MKNSGKCPKCHGSKVAHFQTAIEFDRDPAEEQLVERTRRLRKRLDQLNGTGESPTIAKNLNAKQAELKLLRQRTHYVHYACAGCGYSELYMPDPNHLLRPDVAERLSVEWSELPGGVYR